MTHKNAPQSPQTPEGTLSPTPSLDRRTASDSGRNRRGSVLVNGRIPKRTPCPFADVCHERKAGWCEHQGEAHLVAFSCGVARAFDLCLIKIKKSA